MAAGSFFTELRRRNVIRMAGLYLVAAWLITQVAGTVLPMFDAPAWLPRSIVVLLAIGFVPAIMFAWVYEITPEGIKREADVERHESITPHTGQRMDRAITAIFALALVAFAVDRFVFAPRREAAHDAALRAELKSGANATAGPATNAAAGAGAENPPISAKSIAVLPFVNMSSDKEQEYFSDGMSEELLNLLAKIPALHVAARTSSFSFKGKELPIPQIAKTLLVANVLEGSIRKSGDQVRITAQLVRAADGYHLWSETYDRKLDDIFKVQDEIAGKVVDELKVTLLGSAPKVRTTDPRAYALYLQAVQLGRLSTAEAYEKSYALLQQVLAIDPAYAPAWSEIARNYTNEGNSGLASSSEAARHADEAAHKALAIDPDYAAAYSQLGWVADNFDNDLGAAANYFQKAIALDPTDLNVLRNSAVFLQDLGRVDEALALQEIIVLRDPVNVTVLNNLSAGQRAKGRYDASIATMRTLLTLAPRRGGARYQIAAALLAKGEASAALAECEQDTAETWRMICLPLAYHALGRKADSDAALTALIGKYPEDTAFNIAYVHAFRGEADNAFEWLDKAVSYRDPGLSEIGIEEMFANIHADPRWLPFLRKVGRAPDQLAKIEFKVTLPKEWQDEAHGARAAAAPVESKQ